MKHVDIRTQPIIQAERFVLRPVRLSDLGALVLSASDKRVAQGTRSIPHPLPAGVTEAFIERAMSEDRDEDVWVMDSLHEDQDDVLGVITLNALDRGQSQLGYWVAPGFWNAGIASEAVCALMEANPQGNSSIFAEVFQDNPASARVLTHAGFEYIGDAESHSVARAVSVPTWTYIKKMA
ncbi:Protein N-acetyltransferase, RimJ/RimL family [Aliiroseovarius halocynthiae]|uniref:GNAT family N-acetyltransferase n=1 Tax=Aliiroseovarius halocynthiae TaxID=985055 RepID=A0A545SW00_9RHOB|nr:GNAT family N-acetyltransferase [Aliiroseovarius halocynthiae]TQV69136.1 GNAT family N-acetyltransferase [Aliiroseovarius halocynthiae]SMR71892.1 Protein N-acetyltransferase, RimJ/RimL family [Aliiroseovarius halocynthiae]